MSIPYEEDEAWDEETEDARAEILQHARTDGLKIAYESALELAADKEAPKQARAYAIRTILEIAGLLDHRDRERADTSREKDASEMNGDELRQRIAHAEKRLARLGKKRAKDDSAFD